MAVFLPPVLAMAFCASPAYGQPTGATGALSTDEEVRRLLGDRIDPAGDGAVVVGFRGREGGTGVVAVGDPADGSVTARERTVFRVESLTGVFTGTLLADLARRGEVSLSDPLSRYLRDEVAGLTRAGRELTLFDLATHHRPLRASPPAFAEVPLQRALSRAAGVSWTTLLRDRILDPLEMDDTRTTADPPEVLHSSVRDLLAFLDANLGEPETELERSMRAAREARRAVAVGSGGARDFMGLGWRIRPREGARLVWRGRTGGGSRAFLGFDPDREVGVVVLSDARVSATEIGLDLLGSERVFSRPR